MVSRGPLGGRDSTTAVLDADYLHDSLGWLAGVTMVAAVAPNVIVGGRYDDHPHRADHNVGEV